MSVSLWRRAGVAIAVVLVVVLAASVVTAAIVVRRPLPTTSGEVRIPGLGADVDVVRDDRGIPQIYADDPHDLFFAQGYVHAQDRFFEMDYRRHVTSGRVAELVGDQEAAIQADSVIRTFGWRRVAEQEWDILSQDTRDHLTAYADGVNAYLDRRTPSAAAIEYTVLGTQVTVGEIEPWDPIDSVAWLKAMAWDLRGNFDDELLRAAAYGSTQDATLVADLFPPYPVDTNPPILPGATPSSAASDDATDGSGDQGDDGTAAGPEDADGDATAAASDVSPEALPSGSAEALAGVAAALDAVPHLLGEGDGIGSNSWVVSGEHTATGAPLLANDPHLGISAPGLWYQAGLHCRDVGDACPFDVAGYTFAGMPGVIIGHNDQLAWGLTNLGADVTDFYLERLFTDSTYLRDGERVPVTERTETIEVNGADPIELTVRSTVHGPLVDEVLTDVELATGAPLPEGSPRPAREGYGVSLAWTALEPGRSADAIFAMNLAHDAGDVAAAAELFEVPSQNIVFATTDGTIGYQAPGRIPVRAVVSGGTPSNGTWPQPGWDSRYDWQGWVPAADMPAETDPDEGFVVAANQAVTPPGEGPYLTSDWDYGFRSERIRERLQAEIDAGRLITAETMSRIQSDDDDPAADVLIPALLDLEVDDFTADATALLEDWDHRTDVDSAGAVFFATVWANVLRRTFADQLPEAVAPSGGSQWSEVVRLLLEDPENPWWDDATTVALVETRDEVLADSLVDARRQLTAALGADPERWRWGNLHVAAPEHAVLGGEGIPGFVRRLVNPSPVQVAGGSSIVDATGWDATQWGDAAPDFAVTTIPSMRMVVDLGDLDASTWVNFTGNSGHPASPHYTDQLRAWSLGETYAWPFTADAVGEAGRETLTLLGPG